MTGRRRAAGQWVGYLARRAWFMEVRGYLAIWRFVARRPRVPDDARGFEYHQPVLPVLVVFVVVSAIEVAIVDVVVQRWPTIRIPLLVLGLWGLVWMVGLLCGMLTRPHVVAAEGIRARYGPEVDIALDWADIASVERRDRQRRGKEPALTRDADGATYHLRISDRTNIDITLDGPTQIVLPRGVETVKTVAIWVDDPRGFLDEVRRIAGVPQDAVPPPTERASTQLADRPATGTWLIGWAGCGRGSAAARAAGYRSR